MRLSLFRAYIAAIFLMVVTATVCIAAVINRDHQLLEEQLYRQYLIGYEGVRYTPYLDRCYVDGSTRFAVGIGHTLTLGEYKVGTYTEEEIDGFFHHDLALALAAAHKAIPSFDSLPSAARFVTVSLAFNVGATGFGGFHRYISAISRHQYVAASEELLHSRWATQVPGRAQLEALTLRRLEDSGTYQVINNN